MKTIKILIYCALVVWIIHWFVSLVEFVYEDDIETYNWTYHLQRNYDYMPWF